MLRNKKNNIPWQQDGSDYSYEPGDVARMLLDSDVGTLTVKKNSELLGVMVTGDQNGVASLVGDLCWFVIQSNSSVRIEAVNSNDF